MNFNQPNNSENIGDNKVENFQPESTEEMSVIGSKEKTKKEKILDDLKEKNKKDLENYAEVKAEGSYPGVVSSIYELKKLMEETSDLEKMKDFLEATKYFFSDNAISEAFSISNIKCELQNNPYFEDLICNHWKIIDSKSEYSFIQQQIFESYYKEKFSSEDYVIENEKIDPETYDSSGHNHAKFFNNVLSTESLKLDDPKIIKIIDEIKDKSENFKENPFLYPKLLDFYLKDDLRFRRGYVLTLRDIFDKGDFNKLPRWEMIEESQEMSFLYKSELSDFISKIGIEDASVFTNSWLEADYFEDGSCVIKNLKNVSDLEKIQKGAVKKLYENNGVTRFDRMSPEFWIKQLEIADQEGQYGMFITSRHDHNNAFEKNGLGPKLENISNELSNHDYLTRYIEVANKIDLAKRLLRQDIKFGDQNKIEYAIVFGHGSPDGIILTQDFDEKSIEEVSKADFVRSEDKRYLSKDDFKGEGFKKAKRFFVETPRVGFISCSVGAQGGYAQEFSRTYNADSLAADKPIGIKDLAVSFDNENKPIFNIDYKAMPQGETNKNSFSNGEISKQERIINDTE